MPKAPAAHATFPDLQVFALAVISAGLGQILCGILMQHAFKMLPFGRKALVEMSTNKVFRKVTSPGTAYVQGGAPFVHALLFCVGYWMLDCKPPIRPLLFAVVLWTCGTFHGLIINFCSMRYTFDVTAYFAVTTLVNAVVMAGVVEWIYDKHHWT
jgi:hypothetical protein|uniref:Uncharacterized protein n=1 Tax=Mantoniella antarctica TaxID=81844 RepID=A0A7S0SV06_9CHLO|mmetsp:Transcript_25208/g.40380  ORF Transcript_25208/g.40380 Transcript_25208/m.40380 type:complete len:155 (-) Transcript_25208:132-596(-)